MKWESPPVNDSPSCAVLSQLSGCSTPTDEDRIISVKEITNFLNLNYPIMFNFDVTALQYIVRLCDTAQLGSNPLCQQYYM